MSNVQTGASRDLVDLSHFIFSSGSLGALKVLDQTHVLPGDSFSMDLCGSFRLSALRRGLALDTKVEFFTFYCPHRHTYGDAWMEWLKHGVGDSNSVITEPTLPVYEFTAITGAEAHSKEKLDHSLSFLGTRPVNLDNTAGKTQLPKHAVSAYFNIYNNYFKVPYKNDREHDLTKMTPRERLDGLPCAKLESPWATPLPESLNDNFHLRQFGDAEKSGGDDAIDIVHLDSMYGKLHTDQERDLFMQRYRDVVRSFGGSTHYDADSRPHLVAHTEQWSSGYEVDGTGQETLGQFSGRVQTNFVHSVPRFYVPEHGTMVTVALARFPTISEREIDPLLRTGMTNYTHFAGDPTLIANHSDHPLNDKDYKLKDYSKPRVKAQVSHIDDFLSGWDNNYGTAYFYTAPGIQFRSKNNHVDVRYSEMQGFPFEHLDLAYSSYNNNHLLCIAENYDDMFQTNQLGHWNIQSKANCHVLRRMPTTRDSLFVS